MEFEEDLEPEEYDMTEKQISRLAECLKAYGLPDAAVLECISYVTAGDSYEEADDPGDDPEEKFDD